MNQAEKSSKTQRHYFYRSLVAATFLASGLFPFVAPVLAQTTPPTAANTPINNQATATYEDPNNPPGTPPLTTTSNTVTVTVAEVAGILVEAGAVDDVNGGKVQVGDILEYNFKITNVGNDPTKFHIPDTVTISPKGTLVANSLQYQNPGSGTWIAVPSGGVDTNSVPVNGVVNVRVRVTVNNNAVSGDSISVTLGKTADNQSNVAREIPNDPLDVYTVDNDNGTAPGEVAGVPANGVREGSAVGTKPVDPKFYSLATILKTRGTYDPKATPTDITDDTISYDLSLQVESTDVTGQGITPSPLAGSDIPGLPGQNILVSDAIPTGTQLAATPTPPTGWQAVYSTTAVTTSANSANWTTTPPGDLTTVTRVGFVKSTTDASTYLPLTTGGIQPTQFTIQLKVKTGQTAPLTIANIAQVFGKTPETDVPVLDESGDKNPSNFDGPPGNMTPPANTDNNGDRVPDKLPEPVPNGFVNNPNNPETGTDTQGNNTGTGPGGQANVFTFNTASVLNGPNGKPDAVGPTNNNDDFTNKSTSVPAGLTPGSPLPNPTPVTFNNTLKNGGSQPANISLVPTLPANTGDLPNGTVVTVTSNGLSATYTYNSGTFTFTSGTGLVGGNPIASNNPVRIDSVAANGTDNYTVTVSLPPNSPLSTDPNVQRGFPVPITAFIDTNNNGLPDDPARNISIDRVYTGFLQLLKFSKIEQGQGPAVGTGQDDFETTPSATDPTKSIGTKPPVARTPAPGNIIVYEIRYRNISEVASGTDNVILNAANVVITEDGNTATNNWAKDNDNNGVIDTSHVPGSAVDSGTSEITFFSGNPPSTPVSNATTGTTVNGDVTKYVDTVTGLVAPSPTPRTFTFRRRVN